jgi:putative membrane protein
MSQRIKIGVLLLSISLLTAFGASCGKEGKETANSAPIIKTEPPVKPPSDKGDSVVTGGDLAFMNSAAPGGMAEVELGKMAVEKAQNADVKAFAQKMVDDHSKAGEELGKLAEQKNVKLPTDVMPTHKELMDKLSKLSGAEFDKEYVKIMVEAHKKDVTAFENASKTAGDADVKEFATKTLPTLKMHLEMIQGIADKMGVKMES